MAFYEGCTPPEIYKIIEYYYNNFPKVKNRARIPKEDQKKMVRVLKSAYKKLSDKDRRDVLIPASAEFLQDECISMAPGKYDFRYNWPEPKLDQTIELIKGNSIDRIGDGIGQYVCPLDEKRFSIQERSLPYYFTKEELIDITKSPSYHEYRILNNIPNLKMGETQKGFDQCGGADEIKLDKDLQVLMDGCLIEEMAYATK